MFKNIPLCTDHETYFVKQGQSNLFHIVGMYCNTVICHIYQTHSQHYRRFKYLTAEDNNEVHIWYEWQVRHHAQFKSKLFNTVWEVYVWNAWRHLKLWYNSSWTAFCFYSYSQNGYKWMTHLRLSWWYPFTEKGG